MGEWNLRRVMVETRGAPADDGFRAYVFYGPTRVREVYYDEKGRPWTYADANPLDIIRLWRDWLRTPVLRFPEDFDGEPEWIKELDEAMKSGEWKNWREL